MDIWRAVLLGAAQGLTEFLPVSSSGHLALLHAGGGHTGTLALDVALHAGTLGSMVFFFRADLVRLWRGVTARGEGWADERRRLVLIACVTLATGVVGLGLKGAVERWTAHYTAAGIGFLLTAGCLVWGEMRGRRGGGVGSIQSIPLWHAWVIGVVQGLAVWPGLSRSGSTIATALVLGWAWTAAGRFSFVAAIPAIAGATILMARDIVSLPAGALVAGMLTAFATGTLALWVLMRFLAARRLWPFALYTFGLAVFAFLKGAAAP